MLASKCYQGPELRQWQAGVINLEKLKMSLFGLVFTVAGVGLLVGSYLAYSRERSRLKHWAPTVGVVTGMQERKSQDSEGSTSVTFAPIVEFTLPSGETYRFTGSIASNPPAYSEDEPVRVLYNPRRPSEADIDSPMTHWFGPLALLGMGIVISLAGVSIIRRAKQISTGTEISASTKF